MALAHLAQADSGRQGSKLMIVPALLEIQNRYGYLPPEELEFLALRAHVPLYRVQELTTFFPHFRREPPPRVSLHICQSMTCHLRGAPALLQSARQMAQQKGANQLEVCGVSCLGRCDRAPVAIVSRSDPMANGHGHGELMFTEVGTRHPLPQLVEQALSSAAMHGDHDKHTDEKPNWQIDVYYPGHGLNLEPYAAVKRFLKGELTGDQIIEQILNAGLVGMGGAAARTANKWKEVRGARGETRYVICNADESEPGTFKDRELMLRTPHLIVEGMLLCALTVGASHGYIYSRHEYHEQIEACKQAIKEARKIVPEALQRCDMEVFTSPGLYICGEESALIEVIEGKRAQPRNQPPTIRENGLFDMPTVVNNVETYAWVPSILLRQPPDWYKATPLRFFSISGDVEKPGVFEVPFSCTFAELVQMAGGMRKGMEFHAVAASGPSGGFFPAVFSQAKTQEVMNRLDRALEADPKLGGYDPNMHALAWRKTLPKEVDRLKLLDLPLNVTALRTMGLGLGAAIIIYGAKPGQPISMLEHTLNLLQFFEKESCGKCVPCRLGCQQLVHFAGELQNNRVSLPQVESTVRALSGVMKVTSICGLGRAASVPIATWLEYFRDEKAGR
jgi:NADH:ubiquinone oxidoreductase subunit F (NADH-binding)/NADH:ubiquinone oxidoreductase subunit E